TISSGGGDDERPPRPAFPPCDRVLAGRYLRLRKRQDIPEESAKGCKDGQRPSRAKGCPSASKTVLGKWSRTCSWWRVWIGTTILGFTALTNSMRSAT